MFYHRQALNKSGDGKTCLLSAANSFERSAGWLVIVSSWLNSRGFLLLSLSETCLRRRGTCSSSGRCCPQGRERRIETLRVGRHCDGRTVLDGCRVESSSASFPRSRSLDRSVRLRLFGAFRTPGLVMVSRWQNDVSSKHMASSKTDASCVPRDGGRSGHSVRILGRGRENLTPCLYASRAAPARVNGALCGTASAQRLRKCSQGRSVGYTICMRPRETPPFSIAFTLRGTEK